MTTTGAAKFRHLIQIIKPRITIVEEAAEVLESHIVTSLSPGCQHLILIGDHQQLRPNPTVFDLARNYQLDTSLFERMVKIGMRHERLNSQHRMRPEIASMMKHIYKDLQNHESVMNFESIKGVDSNIFFIEHNEFEEFVQEGRSRSNIHEAKYLAALCRYFILQGYKRTQITILTMYTGQLLQLKKELMPRDFFLGVRVCAVDNFQGEENDIILLSLVRSNEEGQIGFLRTSNRVCVALSRAKKGFYCIGNIDIMCEKEELWRNIIGDMRNEGKVGPHLTLICQKHPKNVIKASFANDFRNAPEGGCTEPCDTRLDCGHVCESVCHPGDPDHKDYKCRQKCTKMLCKDHRCRKFCWQECGECNVLVSKEIPRCLHQQQVPCYKNPSEFSCQAPCLKKQICGLHNCPKRCSEKCDPNCTVMVDKTLKCGHVNKVKCHVDPDQVKCKAPCGELLSCEHLCKGTCGDCFKGRVHFPCKAKCDRRLFCGHLCKESCTKNCPPCMQNCTNRCVHSECKKKCGEPCTPCTMECAWKCTHQKCTMLCGEPCDRLRCNEPCTKILKCKHPCIGMCGEPCPKKCRVCHKVEVTEILFGDEDEPDARFVELEACGHVIEVNAMDQYMDDVAEDDSSIQLKGCPRCKTPIRTTLRYGNAIKTVLADFEKVKAKLIIPEDELELETERLEEKLLSNNLHPKLMDDQENIEKALTMTVLTTEQLNMYENQINFLCFLSKTMNSVNLHVVRILTKQKMKFSREIEFQILDETLQVQALVLRDRIMKLRGRYSDQEKEEINDELLRFSLVTAYSLLLNELKHHDADVDPRLSIIADVIESGRRIGKGDLDRYMDIIKKISVRRGLDIHYQQVTEQEKQLIVQAMGMAQGHWFKCPNGHIYCIGDCGGATVESRCPECKAVIGGTGHALRSDNTLAGEMDGARHSAWSDYTNNMGNFDLNNF